MGHWVVSWALVPDNTITVIDAAASTIDATLTGLPCPAESPSARSRGAAVPTDTNQSCVRRSGFASRRH